ncbi:MAG: methyltransferase domain-containing protein [Candidatus Yanofskybacteria bacterium]|nr:methyltransferase domain-containing protein [Candidatus Yanofskybacteria bacterium]
MSETECISPILVAVLVTLDVQEEPLEATRARAKAANLSNVEFVRANLEVPGSSSLADNSQDIVLVANILFQSPKKSEIVHEAKRVLKDNGQLVMVEWKKGTKGLGPPDEMRLDEETTKQLVIHEGLTVQKEMPAGQFHFALISKK